MQYALFHPSSCCIYTAVSVCMTKLIRLSTRKNAAYVYFLFVADVASRSGLRLRKVDRLAAKAGRALPLGASYEGLPLSSLSSGCCDRPSVGRSRGGRSAISSSSSSSSSSGSAAHFNCLPLSGMRRPWRPGGVLDVLKRLDGEGCRDGGLPE